MCPIRRKHNFEPGALVKYIADTGETPPKDASCNGPSGYWYLAAQVLSGKSNPSFKFVAAVASYWHHNRSDVCVQKKLVQVIIIRYIKLLVQCKCFMLMMQ